MNSEHIISKIFFTYLRSISQSDEMYLIQTQYKNRTTVTLEKDDDDSLPNTLSQLDSEVKTDLRDWWQGALSEEEISDWSNSAKVVLLKALIDECQKVVCH
jgi:replicative superfamily II helicase